MSNYIVGKLRNNRRLSVKKPISIKNNIAKVCVIIVRGIGYRAFSVLNDFRTAITLEGAFVESLRSIYTASTETPAVELSHVAALEFVKRKYLIIRAGHTRDLCLPVKTSVNCTVTKKDRKLTIDSPNKILVGNLNRQVYDYRPPSAYTGRGVRIKHQKPVRKAGKKDKQRGRAF